MVKVFLRAQRHGPNLKHVLRNNQRVRVGKIEIGHGRRRFFRSRCNGRCAQDPKLQLLVEALVQCLFFKSWILRYSSYNDCRTPLGMSFGATSTPRIVANICLTDVESRHSRSFLQAPSRKMRGASQSFTFH